MAKEIARENPVIDALRKLKEEESEIVLKLKPIQEAIGALEKILEKTVKKVKSTSSAKDSTEDGAVAEPGTQEDSQ